MTLQRLSSSAVFLVGLVVSCSAQTITSAHSGTLHEYQGSVTIDGKPVEHRPSVFPEIKDSSVLATQRGRAEVLLTPGVILRIGEGSSIKMLDNRLVSTRVEFLTGSAVLEQIDPLVNAKGNSVVLLYKNFEITLRKNGLIELYAEPASVKVYSGEAEVVAANSRSVVKNGHMVNLNAVLSTEKFNDKTGDDLLLWARDRSQSISTANMASARSQSSGLGSSYGLGSGYGYGYGGYGYGNGSANAWFYNPAYGMFTFLPGAGTYFSPWGYGYFSPYSIYDYYAPSGYIWTGGGRATGLAGVNLPHVSNGARITNTLNRLGRSGPGSVVHSSGPTISAFGDASQRNSVFSNPNGGAMSPAAVSSGSIGVRASAPSSMSVGGMSAGAGAGGGHSAGGRGR